MNIKKTFHFIIGKVVVICIVFLFSNCTEKLPVNNHKTFISITDIHFTPYYDTSLIDDLVKSDYIEWSSIFQHSTIKGYGHYGEEANYPLFSSSLLNMRKEFPHPDFIIIGGDFICHEFERKFQDLTGLTNLKETHKFVEKTIRFLISEISNTFPETAIIPALGNNDSYCGDYQIEANGNFLKMFADVIYPIINAYDMDSSFKTNFHNGGYYTLTSPVNDLHKFIVLNSIFFSAKYKSTKYESFCNSTYDSVAYYKLGIDQLNWLSKQLNDLKKKNHKVWIISHIPPGVNVYKTISGTGTCEQKIATYWKTEFNEKFIGIVDNYSEMISVILSGHTHMDEYKLVHNKDSLCSFVHITPAITPVFENNPGYQVIEYDNISCSFIDYQTYYIDYLTDSIHAYWKPEYRFSETYGYSSVTAETLDSLLVRMKLDDSYRKNYMELFPVGSNNSTFINDSNWEFYKCGIENIMPVDYTDCKCK